MLQWMMSVGIYIWCLVRITLVVAFGFFCPKILGAGGDLPMVLAVCRLSVYKGIYVYRLNGGDTIRRWGHSNSTLHKRTYLNFLRSQAAETQKRPLTPGHKHSHMNHLVEFPLPEFTSHQRSCGKVMFSVMCACHSVCPQRVPIRPLPMIPWTWGSPGVTSGGGHWSTYRLHPQRILVFFYITSLLQQLFSFLEFEVFID